MTAFMSLGAPACPAAYLSPKPNALLRATLSPFPVTSHSHSRRCTHCKAQPSAPHAPAPAQAQTSTPEPTKRSSRSSELGHVGIDFEGDGGITEKTVNDYFEQTAALIKLTKKDGGGPRWFSPLECGAPILSRVPLLLYLPGIDGIGLGLVRQQGKLGRVFETWCMHIPPMDRTPFPDLLELVEHTVKSEHSRTPNRPIYLVGESIGACLAMSVAARNPHIDLVLILANPATSFNNSTLQLLAALYRFELFQPLLKKGLLILSQLLTALYRFEPFQPLLKKGLLLLSSNHSVVADIFPGDTFLWKIDMLQNSCNHANTCLHAIKADTLILSSGKDSFLPSQKEGERLFGLLPRCETHKFDGNGHFLYLEDGVDLLYKLKGINFYRRGRSHDFIADYLPPTPSDFKRIRDQDWWFFPATSPVFLSTLENGEIVKGLGGIPSEGPTLLIGYHSLMAIDIAPMATQLLAEKNIRLRGLAHPMFFMKQKDGNSLGELFGHSHMFRLMGALPVTGPYFFKLLELKSHVLLYPGGVREALHKKGEEYQLFWPERSEFVRMAAKFGAKIVPFGVVGEDDIVHVALDCDDMEKVQFFKEKINELTNNTGRLRADCSGEVSDQPIYFPGIIPKVPGRYYFLFGKPIETEGRQNVLKDQQKAQELYVEVKAEVEKCLAYLKEKREYDPYRSLLSRMVYKSIHGFSSEIPSFEL